MLFAATTFVACTPSQEANAYNCPRLNGGSAVAWFDSIGTAENYRKCNSDPAFLITIHEEFQDDVSIDAMQIIAGTLNYTPLVLGADALSRTKAFSKGDVEAVAWKNQALPVRAFLCERRVALRKFVGTFCSGNILGQYTDRNIIGKTMAIAHKKGIRDYYDYIKGNQFDYKKARAIQKIYDSAAEEADKICSQEPGECSFLKVPEP